MRPLRPPSGCGSLRFVFAPQTGSGARDIKGVGRTKLARVKRKCAWDAIYDVQIVHDSKRITYVSLLKLNEFCRRQKPTRSFASFCTTYTRLADEPRMCRLIVFIGGGIDERFM